MRVVGRVECFDLNSKKNCAAYFLFYEDYQFAVEHKNKINHYEILRLHLLPSTMDDHDTNFKFLDLFHDKEGYKGTFSILLQGLPSFLATFREFKMRRAESCYGIGNYLIVNVYRSTRLYVSDTHLNKKPNNLQLFLVSQSEGLSYANQVKQKEVDIEYPNWGGSQEFVFNSPSIFSSNTILFLLKVYDPKISISTEVNFKTHLPEGLLKQIQQYMPPNNQPKMENTYPLPEFKRWYPLFSESISSSVGYVKLGIIWASSPFPDLHHQLLIKEENRLKRKKIFKPSLSIRESFYTHDHKKGLGRIFISVKKSTHAKPVQYTMKVLGFEFDHEFASKYHESSKSFWISILLPHKHSLDAPNFQLSTPHTKSTANGVVIWSKGNTFIFQDSPHLQHPTHYILHLYAGSSLIGNYETSSLDKFLNGGSAEMALISKPSVMFDTETGKEKKKSLGYYPHYPLILVPGFAGSALSIKKSSSMPSWEGSRLWISLRKLATSKALPQDSPESPRPSPHLLTKANQFNPKLSPRETINIGLTRSPHPPPLPGDGEMSQEPEGTRRVFGPINLDVPPAPSEARKFLLTPRKPVPLGDRKIENVPVKDFKDPIQLSQEDDIDTPKKESPEEFDIKEEFSSDSVQSSQMDTPNTKDSIQEESDSLDSTSTSQGSILSSLYSTSTSQGFILSSPDSTSSSHGSMQTSQGDITSIKDSIQLPSAHKEYSKMEKYEGDSSSRNYSSMGLRQEDDISVQASQGGIGCMKDSIQILSAHKEHPKLEKKEGKRHLTKEKWLKVSPLPRSIPENDTSDDDVVDKRKNSLTHLNTFKTPEIGLWAKHMCLASDCKSDPEGIEVRPVTKTKGCANLHHKTNVTKKITYVMGPLIKNLIKIGYKPDENLFAMPYDWRLPHKFLESRDGFYTNLRLTIENCKMPVIIVAHSMGNKTMQYFFQLIKTDPKYGQEWLDKHIHAMVAVASPWLGSPKVIRSIISGETMGLDPLISKQDSILFSRSLGSTMALLPICLNHFWPIYENVNLRAKSFVYIKDKNNNTENKDAIIIANQKYLPIEYDSSFWAKVDLPKLQSMYDEYYLNDQIFGLHILDPPPIKELYNIYGTGIETEMLYLYDQKGDSPVLDTSISGKHDTFNIRNGVYYETTKSVQHHRQHLQHHHRHASGDGTVPYTSLSYPNVAWQNVPSLKLHIKEIPEAEHRQIICTDILFDILVDIACNKKLK